MIAAEPRGDKRPNLNEALGWIGSRVDDLYGAQVGRLEDVWIDPGTGEPRWLLIKEGRFGGRVTLIPFEDATAGAGHVWVPYEREVVSSAPQIESGAPLTREVETSLRRHYAVNSPAALERAGQLGGAVGPDPTAPISDLGPNLERDRPTPDRSVRMPDRPAPPVAAPNRERDPGPDRPRGSAASTERRADTDAAPDAESAPDATADSAAEQSPPPHPPAQPVGWPYPPVPPYGAAPYPVPPYPVASYGPPYPPPGYPAYPPPPGYTASEAPADPLAGLAGREVEIELEGSVRISGKVRSARLKPDPDA